MRKNKITSITIGAAIIFALATMSVSCGIGDAVNELLNPAEPSKTPVARVTPKALTLKIGAVALINGQGSSDPQSSALTYAWKMARMPSGSSTALSSETEPTVSFTVDKGGFYNVTLQVTNESKLVSNIATSIVNVTGTGDNHPPVANAGADQSVAAGDLAVLEGKLSYDPDGDEITYSWTLLLTPTGSALTTLRASGPENALLYTDLAGTYMARLRVSDGIDTSEDFVTVTATKAETTARETFR